MKVFTAVLKSTSHVCFKTNMFTRPYVDRVKSFNSVSHSHKTVNKLMILMIIIYVSNYHYPHLNISEYLYSIDCV